MYTVLTGKYEQLSEQPIARQSNLPFICLTDDPALRSDTWDVRVVEPLLPLDPVRSQRALKLRPDLHLPDFDGSLYIDNAVELLAPPEAIVALRDAETPIAVPTHSFHTRLRDEFAAVLDQGLDDPARVEEQLRHYEAECPTLLERSPIWTAMLLRDHRDPRLQEAGALWLAQVLRYSRRDQLSALQAFDRAGLVPQRLSIDNHISPFHAWPRAAGRRTELRHVPQPAAPDPVPVVAPPPRRLRRFGRPLQCLAQALWWEGTAPLGMAAGYLDRRDHVLAVEPGLEPRLGPRVAVLAHHCGQGHVAPVVRDLVGAIARQGYSVVITTNAGQLQEEDLAWAREHAALTVIRRNAGYDFAAWRDALRVATLPAQGTERLLLINDSLYGPLRDLGPLFDRLDFDAADVWGATDNWQGRWHLQSYFLALGPRALAHPAFAAFWAGMVPAKSKSAVVRRYEIGFTQAMLAAGLRCAALWPYARLTEAVLQGRSHLAGDARLPAPHRAALAAARGALVGPVLDQRPLNPTAELWLGLLEDGFPFIKRELLARNPACVAGVAAWRDVVELIAPGASAAIEADLRHRMRHRSP